MQSIMLNTLSLYEVFAYFFLYSFLGWVSEVAFHAVKTGKFINRGFLNGPVCPIYGVGVTCILLMLGKGAEKAWLVFLVGIAFPTLIELITGWALETFFHNKWWDYSACKFNFKGYICLEFSLICGLAVLLVIEVAHPLVFWFAHLFGEVSGAVWVCLCAAAMAADLIVTVLQVLKLNRGFKELEEVSKAMKRGSDLIGKTVAGATLAVGKGVSAAKEKCGEAVLKVVAKMPKRLLKAFPSLRSRANPESVPLAQEGIKQLKKNPSYKGELENEAAIGKDNK